MDIEIRRNRDRITEFLLKCIGRLQKRIYYRRDDPRYWDKIRRYVEDLLKKSEYEK